MTFKSKTKITSHTHMMMVNPETSRVHLIIDLCFMHYNVIKNVIYIYILRVYVHEHVT